MDEDYVTHDRIFAFSDFRFSEHLSVENIAEEQRSPTRAIGCSGLQEWRDERKFMEFAAKHLARVFRGTVGNW